MKKAERTGVMWALIDCFKRRISPDATLEANDFFQPSTFAILNHCLCTLISPIFTYELVVDGRLLVGWFGGGTAIWPMSGGAAMSPINRVGFPGRPKICLILLVASMTRTLIR